jgi:hypothetical protein
VRKFAHDGAIERIERLRAIEPDETDAPARFDNDIFVHQCLAKLLLTYRTIKGRAPVLHDAPDGAPAARGSAGLAFPIVDAKVMLEHSEIAVGQSMIPQR